MMLRRELSGIPGVIVRARPSGGQNNMMRGMGGGGGDGRLSIEILGHDLETSKSIAQDLKTMLDSTPGIADTRLQREEGRPELAVRVDRDKAALLGLTVTGVANTIRTNVAGTQAAMFRDAGNEYPIVVRLRQSDREEVSEVGDVLLSTPSGQVLPAKNVMVIDRGTGPVSIERKNQERVQRVNAETETTLSEAVEAVQRPDERDRRAEGLRGRLRQRGRGAGAVVPRAAARADPRDRPGLHRDGVAVRVAARSVHHHLLDSAGGDRRGRHADDHRHAVQHAGLHRGHHAGRHRGQ